MFNNMYGNKELDIDPGFLRTCLQCVLADMAAAGALMTPGSCFIDIIAMVARYVICRPGSYHGSAVPRMASALLVPAETHSAF